MLMAGRLLIRAFIRAFDEDPADLKLLQKLASALEFTLASRSAGLALGKKKKYRLRGRSSETAKAHRG
eukprot:TRINITY_DN985_c0_g1_i1.p3 TRINITY_DN985_c0_g1~~TRINITY_DN985_c0_g1_i1.p3  ORF type:complete len:68 (+),score=34.41 TRINITY_DN985_c0_g1_i1:277-480(+)